MMKYKVAIIGAGPSIKAYKGLAGFDQAMGANDAYSRTQELTAVCAADPYRDIARKRPEMLNTPKHIHFYVRHESNDWAKWLKDRGNFSRVKTRRCAFWTDCTPYEAGYLHGYHTPFMIASIALFEFRATDLYFYGIDGGGFTHSGIANVIKELNYLTNFCTVHLPAISELWQRQEHKRVVISERHKQVPIRLNDKIVRI